MSSLKSNESLTKSIPDPKNASLKLLQGYDSDSYSEEEGAESNHNIVLHAGAGDAEFLNESGSNKKIDKQSRSISTDCSVIANLQNSNLVNDCINADCSSNDLTNNVNSTMMNNSVSMDININSNQQISITSDPGVNMTECHDNIDNAVIENDNSVIVMDYDIQDIADGKCSESSPGDSSSDSDSDSSSEWESLKGVEECSDSDDDTAVKNTVSKTDKKNVLKVKGELGLDDLPPIQDLTLSVPNQDCMLIGAVYDIVDQLVIIESLPNKPALDIDTVLFLNGGAQTLGKIFDVFGQVAKPFYCVRFNSKDHINEKGIALGISVYCAPKTEHTNLVFVSELMKLKGSDASWKNDEEPPLQFLEFSDDEEERIAKRVLKEHKKKTNFSAEERGETSSAQKRNKPTEFEQRMNRKNLQKTAESNRMTSLQQRFNPRLSNPFSRRTSTFSNPGNNSDIQWSQNAATFFVGGNAFAPFGAFSPGTCGRPGPQRGPSMGACPPLGAYPPMAAYPPMGACPPPPFMRPPRFTAPPPSLPAQRPLWFMTRPPSAPPGT